MAVVVVVLGLVWLGQTAGSQLADVPLTASESALIDPALEASLSAAIAPAQAAAVQGRMVVPGTDPAVQPAPRPASMTFAAFDDLPLDLPVVDVVRVTFRQATSVEALPLAPVGSIGTNGHPSFEPPRELPGPTYHVAAPSGHVHHATSAVDVVAGPAGQVIAPVAGEVVAVAPATTAEGLEQWQIVLRPDLRPDVQVVLSHLMRPPLVAGDRVAIGDPLGVAHRTPGTDGPHVALTLRPGVGTPDPDAPAVRD